MIWNIKVSTEEQTDIREQVFYKMAEVNCPILEMQSKKVSLEEIFLELTEGEKRKLLLKLWKTSQKIWFQRKEMWKRRKKIMIAIYKRELKGYLTSMIGYLFIFLCCF